MYNVSTVGIVSGNIPYMLSTVNVASVPGGTAERANPLA